MIQLLVPQKPLTLLQVLIISFILALMAFIIFDMWLGTPLEAGLCCSAKATAGNITKYVFGGL